MPAGLALIAPAWVKVINRMKLLEWYRKAAAFKVGFGPDVPAHLREQWHRNQDIARQNKIDSRRGNSRR